MFGRLSHTRLLRYAGLFTWALVGVPLIYTALFLEGSQDVTQPPQMSWQGWMAYGVFGALYIWLTRAMDGRRIRYTDYVLLLMLTGSAVAVSYYSLSGLGSILLMVVACVLPWLLPLSVGVAVLVLSQFAIAPVYVMGQEFDLASALLQSVLYAGFCGFIFVTSLVARQQAQARDDQRRLNAELRATRVLLAESARVNERTRISRELHDLLGHHLTALSLNLEVASHLTEGKAQEHVRQAHTLARLLLTDVREAVSQLREGGAIDVGAALRPLAENVPALDIEMQIDEPLTMDDPERAHVLLRCTQEIITNTVRHANAGKLWIGVHREKGQISIEARDDGDGVETILPGNGLRGMRERLQQYQGTLQVESHPGQGFRLRVCLPANTVQSIAEQGVPA